MLFRSTQVALAALLTLSLGLSPALAADTKISALNAAGTLTGTEPIPSVQGGAPVKLTPSQLLAYTMTNGAVATTSAKGFLPQLPGGTTTFLRGDGTFAAPPSGSGGAVVARGVGYASGRYYPQGRFGRGSSVATANVLYALPLQIDTDTTVTGLAFRVTTAASGTAAVAGIYANSAGAPGTLMAQGSAAADMGTAPANTKTTFSSALSLPAGLYWVLTNFNGAPTVTTVIASDAQANALIGAPDNANAAQTYVSLTATYTYTGSLPSTAPAMLPSTALPPLTFFGVQ